MNTIAHLGSLIYLDLSDNPLGPDFFSPDLREKRGPGSRRSSQGTSRNGSVAGSGVGMAGRGKGIGLEGSVGQLSHHSHLTGTLSGPSGSVKPSGLGGGIEGSTSIASSLGDGKGGGVGGGGKGGGGVGFGGDLESLSSSSQALNPAYHLPEGRHVHFSSLT